MSYKFNPLVEDELDYYEHGALTVTSDPASASVGDIILNTTDGKMKIWYDSTWQELHSFSVEDTILLENGDNFLLENADNLLIG